MGFKRFVSGNNHDLYLACCLGLIFLVAGCYHRVPQQAPPAAGLECEACRRMEVFKELVDKGAFQQAQKENNRVRACLDLLSERKSLSTAVLKQDIAIYTKLLNGLMARDKQNRALLKTMDSMEKTAKKLQKKIKNQEQTLVRLRNVAKENARLKQQIKSYKAIDLGLDKINPKPGDNNGSKG